MLPSPHHYLEEPAYGVFFAFWGSGRFLVVLTANVAALPLDSHLSVYL